MLEREHARRLAANNGNTPESGRRELRDQIAVARLCFIEETFRDERATTAHVARELDVPARQLEQLDCRATNFRLGVAREGVGQEYDRPAAGTVRRRQRFPPREPPLQGLSLELWQRSTPIDAGQTLDQRP